MDTTGRLLVEELGKILGTKIIPLNKPGAASILGTDEAARSKNDGYTMVYASAAGLVYIPASNPEIVNMESLGEYKSPSELRKLIAEQYEVAYALAVKMGLRK
jgi:tripartite-type tricarboxylate transporter receptor subunit TctC